MAQTVIWQPNPGPQTEVLTRTEDEILYGGARGGGKTDAGVAWPLRWIDNEMLRFLVIRRNSQDLADWKKRAKMMWRHLNPEFTNTGVVFPSGASGVFGHLHDDDAYERYMGHEYQKMIIEELTHIPTEDLYLNLTASCRSTVPGLTAQIFNTTNPGSEGHEWVKRRFVDVAKPGERFTFTSPSGIELTRIFIPARVEDNPILVNKDPRYVAFLQQLPEYKRKAWYEGNWDIIDTEGAYYTSYVNKARQDGRITSVPYDQSTPVHTWWDIGIGDATSIGFFQIVGREWHLIDYYENSGEGLKHYAEILQDKKITLGYTYGRHYGPHDIQARELGTGKTRQETAQNFGIDFEIVPKQTIEDGIEAVRSRFSTLWIDRVRCERLVSAIQQYRKEWNEKMGIWGHHPVHDWTSHGADMLRYWAITDFTEDYDDRSDWERRDDDRFDPFKLTP